MVKSDVFLILCLSFVAGVFVASFWIDCSKISIGFIGGLIIIGSILIGVFWHKQLIIVVGFCLIVMSLGIYCFQIRFLAIKNNILISTDQQTATLIGSIVREPQASYKNLKLIVSVEKVIFDTGQTISSPNNEIGKAIIYTNRYNEFKYNDKIQAVGEIGRAHV